MEEIHNALRPFRRAEDLIEALNSDFHGTRHLITEYFHNLSLHEIEDHERPLSYSLFRSMVHALADNRLSPRGARFIQALFLKHPDEAFSKLLGALHVGHKENQEGANRRVEISKRLLKRKKFATLENLDAFLHDLRDPESGSHVAELLRHPTYSENQALLGKMVNELAVMTTRPGYAPVLAEQVLLDLMEKPEAVRHLEAVVKTREADVVFRGERKWWVISPEDLPPLRAILSTGIRGWATRTVANSTLFRLEDSLHGVASQRILSHPHFIENPEIRKIIIHRLLYNIYHKNPVKSFNSVSLLQKLVSQEEIRKEVEKVLSEKKLILVKNRAFVENPLDPTHIEKIREQLDWRD